MICHPESPTSANSQWLEKDLLVEAKRKIPTEKFLTPLLVRTTRQVNVCFMKFLNHGIQWWRRSVFLLRKPRNTTTIESFDTPPTGNSVTISIAVSARNGMPYLEECIASILRAGEGLDAVVHYADACSSDASVDCARRLLGDDQVNVEEDEGWGDAINRIFSKSTGDIFGAIGADDMLAPDSLMHVSRAFAENPGARWAIGLYEIIDEQNRPIRRFHCAYKNFAIRHFRRPWLMAENIIPNVSFFIRRDFREEVGEMLLERETLANDYDYFIRCAKRARPLIIPHVLGRWRYHRTSQSGRNMHRMSRDAWKVCRSHTRNPIYLAANALCSLRNALLFDKVG